MAFKILRILISNGTKTNEELLKMADVYYGAGRITSDQYTEIMEQINKKTS